MKKIGFDGGHTVYELGIVSDVVLFFECINRFVINLDKENDWSLLNDRLYKRYLRKNELDKAVVLMDVAKNKFYTLPASVVLSENKLHVNLNKTSLDFNQETLGDIFFRFFDLFSKAIYSAISFLDEFGIYQPVRLVLSDMPYFILDKRRGLHEYDALGETDIPFWLR